MKKKEVIAMLNDCAATFVSCLLMKIIELGSIYKLDWSMLFNAAVVMTLPVIIQFLNKKNTRYGIKNEL